MKIFIFIILCIVASSINAQVISKDYFGCTPPNDKPEIFAPRFICLENRIEGRGTFSPDGNHFYFTVSDENFINQKIMYTKYSKDGWSIPDTASFSYDFACWEPFFSDNGNKIYFTGNIESNLTTKSNGQDFYFTQKIDDEWKQPCRLKEPINSDYTDLFFSKAKSGNIYFTSERPDGRGIANIYIAKKLADDEFSVNEIGNSINNRYYNWDPCISQDESFMIYASASKLRKKRLADLFITYRVGDRWTKPKRLSNKINTNANEYGPFLSNDNRYLFFTRLGDGNQGDIYWVDLNTIIDKNKIMK